MLFNGLARPPPIGTAAGIDIDFHQGIGIVRSVSASLCGGAVSSSGSRPGGYCFIEVEVPQVSDST